MDRQEYLKQMQTLREELQANARKRNEAMDSLCDQYRQDLTVLNEEKRAKERQIRDEHQSAQQDIERKMNALKMQWAQEHPVNEIRIVE